MGQFLRQLLMEQDAPVGAGVPAGDPELCFDPNTGLQIECPPAGETQAAAGGGDPALGGGPANQDAILAAESKKNEDEDEVEPDKDGACPEGYEKGEDGKCKKLGGSEGDKDDKDKKEEALLPEGDRPPWMKDDDDDKDDDDEDDDDDKDDDDDDDDKKDKDESLMYRSAVKDLVDGVLNGGNARELVRKAFTK
jgi:hypothetical protein